MYVKLDNKESFFILFIIISVPPNKILCLLKIFLGRICLDILKDKWSPALQIRTVLLSIQALLSAPNPDDPLANDVAELWKVNEIEAIRNAKEWTQRYAMEN